MTPALHIQDVTFPAHGQAEVRMSFEPLPGPIVIGFNLAIHFPPPLEYVAGSGAVVAPGADPTLDWRGQFASVPGIASVIGYQGGSLNPPALQLGTCAVLSLRNMGSAAIALCGSGITFTDVQLGGTAQSWTCDVAPTCVPSDVGELPASAWTAVKEVYR